MEFIYKIRHKKTGLYTWRNSLEKYILVLGENADLSLWLAVTSAMICQDGERRMCITR
jgi:hypothetical protein